MADEQDGDSLTGVWHGQYVYPLPGMPPAGFVATLIEFGEALSGTTHETLDGKGGTRQTRNAVIEGTRQASAVTFIKTYSPASEEFQDVIYQGTVNADASEIEGQWMIPGVWAGRFLMIRNRSQAKAARRSVEEKV